MKHKPMTMLSIFLDKISLSHTLKTLLSCFTDKESKTWEGINLSQVREQYRHTWELHLDSLVPKVGL